MYIFDINVRKIYFYYPTIYSIVQFTQRQRVIEHDRANFHKPEMFFYDLVFVNSDRQISALSCLNKPVIFKQYSIDLVLLHKDPYSTNEEFLAKNTSKMDLI